LRYLKLVICNFHWLPLVITNKQYVMRLVPITHTEHHCTSVYCSCTC